MSMFSTTASMTRSHGADAGEVVVEVAGAHEHRAGRVRKRRGAGLEGLVETALGEAVARRGVGLLRFAQPGRNDVEQLDLDARVGKVRRDAGAHDACAEHRDPSDGLIHGDLSSPSGSVRPCATRRPVAFVGGGVCALRRPRGKGHPDNE
jgi:hypothetical protein